MNLKKTIGSWITDRFDVEKIREPINYQLKKPLPPHTGWFHTLGSLSLFLFISQVLTGILLLIYYRPTIREAFESVQFIMTKPYLGWLYRQVHAWGGQLMIIIVFLHMLRTFITGSFKKPREITWISGVILFLTTLGFGFTGYLLPWNQLAYWATTVGTEIPAAIPWVGDWLKTFLRGGPNVGGETLSRFFVIHVIILPWAVFFLIAMHLFLVRFQGIATLDPVGEEKDIGKKGIPFFPHHLLKEGVVFFILLGVLVTLAIVFPFELGEKADPMQTPHAIKPEWYFLPMYQVLKFAEKMWGLLIISLAPLFLFLWPFLDKSRPRNPLKRPLSMTFFVLVLLSLLIFGLMGYFSEKNVKIFNTDYHIDIYGMPHKILPNATTEPTHEK
ncbi:MAG: cytochrome bc complex cytochrome b subunit [Candidatus Omnitrophica bacterium]|nr:cytochrome bc complex cytochrome b subunit [Candidatus Omnitrophota bacterium]